MRDVSTKPAEFRQLLAQITQLMTYEVTRDFAVEPGDCPDAVGRL